MNGLILNRTADVASGDELKRLFGMPPEKAGDGQRVDTCTGSWIREVRDWRFYELADEDETDDQ